MNTPIQLVRPTYRETFWNHDGLQICTYEWGEYTSDKPTLLFLHGWLDHGASWNTVATSLVEKGYHCLAIDHRGHGHSGHISPYDEYHFADYISDIQAFIQTKGLDDFILIGHSMGGTIASIYAGLCSIKPKACILIDGLGPKHESESEATHRLKLHLRQRSQHSYHRPMTLETGIKKLRRAHPFLSEDSLRQEVLRLTKPAANEELLTWRWDARHRNKSAISFSLPRFIDILRHIECPVHCLFGKESWYLQLPDIPERLKAILTLHGQILLPSGHSPHVECPHILFKSILNCLQEKATKAIKTIE